MAIERISKIQQPPDLQWVRLIPGLLDFNEKDLFYGWKEVLSVLRIRQSCLARLPTETYCLAWNYILIRLMITYNKQRARMAW